jgi:hypothetical protein
MIILRPLVVKYPRENYEEEKTLVRRSVNSWSDEGKSQMVGGCRHLRSKKSDDRTPVANADEEGNGALSSGASQKPTTRLSGFTFSPSGRAGFLDPPQMM